jgi:hypothetical protein
LLQIYEEALPAMLGALLPKNKDGLTQEQEEILRSHSEAYLHKRPQLWERLNELVEQVAAKRQEVAYLEEIANTQ